LGLIIFFILTQREIKKITGHKKKSIGPLVSKLTSALISLNNFFLFSIFSDCDINKPLDNRKILNYRPDQNREESDQQNKINQLAHKRYLAYVLIITKISAEANFFHTQSLD
jgi:hypothetical protein